MLQRDYFLIGKEVFPICVDYNQDIGAAWSQAVKSVVWHGDLELEGRTFPNRQLGQSNFNCRYAILQKNISLIGEDRLCELRNFFSALDFWLADMMQLFAFVCRYTKQEITPKKSLPVVAAAEGSTWRCSHDILCEMAGVSWDFFYHNPGPMLSTISEDPSDGFEKGTIFLIVDKSPQLK
jgi:hypothetical protein